MGSSRFLAHLPSKARSLRGLASSSLRLTLPAPAPSSGALEAACEAPTRPRSSTPWLRQDRRPYSAPARHAAHAETYNRQRQQVPLNHMVPDVAVDAWVAPSAVLVGGVTVEDGASVWHGAVLRGDLNLVLLGAGSSIGDRTVVAAVPTTPNGLPGDALVGRNVTVGPGTVLRGCEVEDEAVVGAKCVVMEGAVVEKGAVLQDASVVAPGQLIPGGQVWGGNPARFVRALSEDEKAETGKIAAGLRSVAAEYAAEFLPFSSAYIQAESLKGAKQGKGKAEGQ